MELNILNDLPVYDNNKGIWTKPYTHLQEGYVEFWVKDLGLTFELIPYVEHANLRDAQGNRAILVYCLETRSHFVLTTSIDIKSITKLCMYYKVKGRYISSTRIKQIEPTKIYLR